MAMRKREARAWAELEAKEEEVYYLLHRVLRAEGKPATGESLYQLLTEMAEGVAQQKATRVVV